MLFTFYYSTLFILGTIFGSFTSVLIERWHSGKGGILQGRSECPKCHKQLGFFELFPILSYVCQGGKCSGCKTKISAFYPILEGFMGIVFILGGMALYRLGIDWSMASFWIVLMLVWVTGVYIAYDIRYREIPDQIILPTIYIYTIIILFGLFRDTSFLLFDYPTYPTFHTYVSDHIFTGVLLYTFFYFQILIPGGIFLLKKGEYSELLKLLLTYFTLPFISFIELFRKNPSQTTPEIEIPTWIGGGDLRVALLIGITLGSIHGTAAFAIAYITGSIVGICILLLAKYRRMSRQKEIAFGPFLGLGWICSLIFYQEILNITYSIF